MRICPKCSSWRVQTVDNVIRSYRCPNCDWMGIGYIGQSLQFFPSWRPLRFLRRFSWVYVLFILVILGSGYLISAEVITPAKYFSFLDKLPLFSEESVTEGNIKSKSVMTEAPAIPLPSTRAVPVLPAVSPSNTESAPLQNSDNYHVVANSDSKLYHLPGMKYYNNISSHHRVIFISEEEARQAGYRKAPR
jgi:hypothetical protein